MADQPDETTEKQTIGGLEIKELPSTQPANETPTEGTEGMTAPEVDISFEPLKDYLGIAHPDDEEAGKMKFIWGFFQKGRERADALQAIKNTMATLTQPEIGESRLHQMYAYTRLMAESRSIEKEKRVYESGR